MTFERAFAISSVLLAAVACSGLLFAQSLPLWLALPTALILILSLLQAGGMSVVRRTMARLIISPALSNSLSLGAFVIFLVDLIFFSRDLLPAGIHFLVLLLNIKLLTLQQRRDYRHLYALSLMAILASAAVTSDAWYVPIFLLYLLAAVWTLVLYHMTQETGPATGAVMPAPQSIGPAAGPSQITAPFLWLTNGVVAMTVGMTLAIFFVIPRVGVGALQKTSGEALRTSGFSERVDLGTIGSVKQDPQIVMRVELPDRSAVNNDQLYLRGLAYDEYNGRSWSHSRTRQRSLGLVAEGIFLARPPSSRPPGSQSLTIRQDILLETLDTAVLFAAPFAELVSGEFLAVQADGMSGLHLSAPPVSRLRYSVTSQAPQLLEEERTATALDYPEAVRSRYLQVPAGLQRIDELAHRVVLGAATPFDRTLAVQQHLLDNYRYSLDAEQATLNHPLEEFLFTRKTGYCEHYATAMVVMLRTLGIPARLVTGFLATEWNEYGGYFTVRQRDAHAWVEVYFPHSGWITMDPTPAVNAAAAASRWESLSRFGASLRLQWDRLFVSYSAKDQLAVVHGMREGSDFVREKASRWVVSLSGPSAKALSRLRAMARRFQPGLAGLVTGLFVVGLAIFLLMVRDRIGLWATLHLPIRPSQGAILQLYARMLRILEQQGLRKPPSATAREFAGLVEREWQAAGPLVDCITDLYQQGRFSRRPLSQDDLSLAAEQVGQLQSLRRM